VGRRNHGHGLHELFREVFALRDALAGVMDQVHEQTGLSTPKRRALNTLQQGGPATMPDMAHALGVSRQFMRAVCNELLAEGQAEFVDNPRHKRSKLVILTEQGRAALERAQGLENKLIEGAVSDVPPERVDQARELLVRLRERVAKLAER